MSKSEAKWKTLSSKEVHKNPWYSVFCDRIERPDGSETEYYVLRKPHGVAVIPFDGERVYLTNQFRYSLGKRVWGFVAGTSKASDYEQMARDELKEEAGFRAEKLTYIGEFACGPGHTNHMAKVYLAEGLKTGKPEREDGEIGMFIKGFTVAEVDDMINKGEAENSWLITPWYFFKEYLKKQ